MPGESRFWPALWGRSWFLPHAAFWLAFPGAVPSHAAELYAAGEGLGGGEGGAFPWPRVPVSLLSQQADRLLSFFSGGTMAQQVPVQAIQVHQAPQQTSPSSDSSTDLTQTSSSGTGNWDITVTAVFLPNRC